MPITILQIILSTRIRYSRLNDSLWNFLRQKIIFKMFILPLCHLTYTKNRGPVVAGGRWPPGWWLPSCHPATAGQERLVSEELSFPVIPALCIFHCQLPLRAKLFACCRYAGIAKEHMGAVCLDITILRMKAVLLWNFYWFFPYCHSQHSMACSVFTCTLLILWNPEIVG